MQYNHTELVTDPQEKPMARYVLSNRGDSWDEERFLTRREADARKRELEKQTGQEWTLYRWDHPNKLSVLRDDRWVRDG